MALRSQLALVKRLWMSGWGRGGERLQLSPRACRVPALSPERLPGPCSRRRHQKGQCQRTEGETDQ